VPYYSPEVTRSGPPFRIRVYCCCHYCWCGPHAELRTLQNGFLRFWREAITNDEVSNTSVQEKGVRTRRILLRSYSPAAFVKVFHAHAGSLTGYARSRWLLLVWHLQRVGVSQNATNWRIQLLKPRSEGHRCIITTVHCLVSSLALSC
jgi:hypothetical protein